MPRIAALGRLALLTDQGRLADSPIRGRSLALLALLARAGEAGLAREKIAALLWPESDEARARHSLDQALYTIRRVVGAEAFRSGASVLALDSRVLGSDVADFVRALAADAPGEAVEVYGGPFLDGFHLSQALEFERWADAERTALHHEFVGALETLAREASARGDRAAAVAYWRRLAGISPLSARVALELMRALAKAGEHDKAIQTAEVHTALVWEELSARADPSVLAFAEELRAVPLVSAAPTARGSPAAPPILTGAGGSPTVQRPAATPRRGRPLRAIGIGVGLMAGLVLTGLFLAGRRSAGAEGPPRVRVAPFQNETGDAEYDPLGQMAADWITEGLTQTGIVRVIGPRTGQGSVESIIEGRVYRRGDSVWIQARVTRGADGFVQRAIEAVGTSADSPSSVLEPLRQRVLGALGTLYDPRLAAWAGTALRPPSYLAYQQFAAGLELHAAPRDLPAAAERFRRAGELDPDYVLPWLWLAWSRVMIDDYRGADSVLAALVPRRGDMSPLERAWHERISALVAGDNERSYQAARLMVDLAPESAWALSLANAALDTDRPEVAVSVLLETGIENLALEREHGWSIITAAYHRLGDHHRELAVSEAAIRSDGLNWGFSGPGVPALAALGRIHDLERRLDELHSREPYLATSPKSDPLLAAVTELRAHGFVAEAEHLADRALTWERQHVAETPALVARQWDRVRLLYELGRWAEAQRLLDGTTPGASGFRHRAMAGLLAARWGDRTTARKIAAELASIDRPYLFGEATFWRARIEAVLGDSGAAMRLLRQAFLEGQGAYAWHQLHVARDFALLRDDPEFRRMLQPLSAR